MTDLALQEQAPLSVTTADEGEDGAVAAAIAAALEYFRAQEQAQLGKSLQVGRGTWWAARRAEASQGKPERRW